MGHGLGEKRVGLTLAGGKSRWVLFGVDDRRVFNEGGVQPYFTWKSLSTPGLSVFSISI